MIEAPNSVVPSCMAISYAEWLKQGALERCVANLPKSVIVYLKKRQLDVQKCELRLADLREFVKALSEKQLLESQSVLRKEEKDLEF